MSQATPIRILLAEDHLLVREGFAAIIKDEADMVVVAQAANGQQAVALYRQHQPDITLMDLRMPQINGVEAITQSRAEFPTACIIVLTTYDGDEDIYRGLQAGARGYLLKDMTPEELLDAIRLVYQEQKYIPPQVALKIAEGVNNSALTERESEVLRLMAIGKSNHEIVAALSITERTVKFHVNNILTKLRVIDRTQAVILALKRGLVRLET